MDDNDKNLILRVLESNRQLRRLYDTHRNIHSKLEELENRSFLTSAEETELKRLKWQKLSGVKQMMEIIEPHREHQAA